MSGTGRSWAAYLLGTHTSYGRSFVTESNGSITLTARRHVANVPLASLTQPMSVHEDARGRADSEPDSSRPTLVNRSDVSVGPSPHESAHRPTSENPVVHGRIHLLHWC